MLQVEKCQARDLHNNMMRHPVR